MMHVSGSDRRSRTSLDWFFFIAKRPHGEISVSKDKHLNLSMSASCYWVRLRRGVISWLQPHFRMLLSPKHWIFLSVSVSTRTMTTSTAGEGGCPRDWPGTSRLSSFLTFPSPCPLSWAWAPRSSTPPSWTALRPTGSVSPQPLRDSW